MMAGEEGKNMNMKELKRFLTVAGEETEELEEALEDDEFKIEFLSYLVRKEEDCKQAIRTLSGSKKEEYIKNLSAIRKATKMLNGYTGENFVIGMVTRKYIFTCNYREGDENNNTKMYTSEGELISDNYFAYEALIEEIDKAKRKETCVLYASEEIEKVIND